MAPNPLLSVIDPEGDQPAQTVEIRARIPAQLRDRLEHLASRSFRSLAGEVAAACSSWVEHHAKANISAPAIAAGLLLLAAPPVAAQPVPRVPVPLVNSFAAREAEICGTVGGTPFSTNGCLVPRTAGCPAFRLKINARTGEVTTSRLEPGHILLQLDEWERFQRSKPSGR